MATESNNKVSIWVALLIAVVTAIITGIVPPALEFYFKRQDEKRNFLLQQVQAYGAIYFISAGGTKKQLLEELNNKVGYLDLNEKEAKLVSDVLRPGFPLNLSQGAEKDMALDWLKPGGRELSEIFFDKYDQKLKEYMRLYIKK